MLGNVFHLPWATLFCRNYPLNNLSYQGKQRDSKQIAIGYQKDKTSNLSFCYPFPMLFAFLFLSSVLAAECRHKGGKNDPKRQKTRYNSQNQPKIKGKTRLNDKCNLLVAVVIENFSRYGS